jgi:serine/threonine protein kinase
MPTGVEFATALQHPQIAFADPALRTGYVRTNRMGLPAPVGSGAFASVFEITDVNSNRWAVKCFTQRVNDREERYRSIDATLASVHLTSLIGFEYQPQGIQVATARGVGRFPIVKMEWVEAIGLLAWLDQNFMASKRVEALADQFADLASSLDVRGISHGDLQHGNLLIDRNDRIRLIDYDGMYVPSLAGRAASERGLANYQSPRRRDRHFGPGLDRFSAWVIYGSLLAVAIAPYLWTSLHGPGDEKLLLGRDDYENPATSAALLALRGTGDMHLDAFTSLITASVNLEPDHLQPLDPKLLGPGPTVVQTASAGPPPWLREALRTSSAAGPSTVPTPQGSAVGTTTNTPAGPSWLLSHLPSPPIQRFRGSVRAAALHRLLFWATTIAAALLMPDQPLASVALAVTTLTGLAFAYQHQPLVRSRKQRRTALRQTGKQLAMTQKELRVLRKARLPAGHIPAEVHRLEGKRVTLERKHQDEPRKIDHRLQRRLADVARSRQQLGDQHSSRWQAALNQLRAAHIQQQLSRTWIRGDPPPGIGQGLVARLDAAQIRTAADFIGYRDGMIIRPNKTMVRVADIGPSRGNSLAAWRDQLETAARRTAPNALPRAEADALARALEADMANTEAQAAGARGDASHELAEVQRKYQAELANLDRQIRQAQAESKARQANVAVQIGNAERAEAQLKSQLDQARQQHAAYRQITLVRYLTFVAIGRN